MERLKHLFMKPRGKTGAPARLWAGLVVPVGLWILCGNVTAAQGVTVESMLVPPSQAIISNQSISVTVIFKNPGSKVARFSFPNEVIFELTRGEQQTRLPAVWMAAPVKHELFLTPGAFSEQQFSIPVPAVVSGYARLKMIDPPSNTVILEIANSGENVSGEDRPEPPPPGGETKLEAMESKIRPYLANLSFYDSNYFLAGADPKKSKFQLSFKYRLFREHSLLSERSAILQGMHLAYTQTSYWDLKSDSAPFEDTSYKPELFFVSPSFDLKLPWLYTANAQIGAQHESNGRGGDASRSTNILYFKPIFMFAGKSEDAGIMIAPRFMVYVGNDVKTNPDLPDYRGYVDLEIKTGLLEGFILDTHFRYGEKGGSAQFDLSYPLTELLGSNVDLYFYTQYYIGYAESLLHYDRKESALRFGFSIAR
ncbi:MAG: phospholipase A [Desulfobacterales bacterium]|nr:phospholipase A [Desulfobacterales bacterium]